MLVRKGSKIFIIESNEMDSHLKLDLEGFAEDVLKTLMKEKMAFQEMVLAYMLMI